MPKQSVLIIKHGFSEICDHNLSPVVSYGDVFRCTCLLEEYRGEYVTWITARKALDLLSGNHLIDQLILADAPDEIPPGFVLHHYDVVINLEKNRAWCEFATNLYAEQKYGFRDWQAEGDECFYPASTQALSRALNGDHYRTLQEMLFQTVGRQWHGQRYVLGYQPKVVEMYDVGLNHHVGPKWPNKTWPENHWRQLHDRLDRQNYALCWQQSLNSIRHYIDWLASCRLIVTCDSLGLHLALALRKKVVALFGPTAPQQIHLYGLGVKLTPAAERNCIPCLQSQCQFDHRCMEYLSVNMVGDAVNMLMDKSEPVVAEGKRVAEEAVVGT